MKYQIQRKNTTDGTVVTLYDVEFHDRGEAQSYADDMNDLHPDLFYWVMDVIEEPFIYRKEDDDG